MLSPFVKMAEKKRESVSAYVNCMHFVQVIIYCQIQE